MLRVAERHNLAYAKDLAKGVLGWAHARLGDPVAGAALIRNAVADMETSGARIGITDVLTRLAEAEALAENDEAALEAVTAALTANPQERVFTPHGFIVRGGIWQARRRPELAEADFLEALGLARGMQARSWELRAALGLARLDIADGDSAVGIERLAALEALFEGEPDQGDLAEARRLLDDRGARRHSHY